VLEWNHELDSLRRAYETAEDEFKAQQPMLSEDALRARQQELETMRTRYETFAQDIWGEGGKMEQKHKELFAPVIDKMDSVIEVLALDKGYELVLDVAAGGILYADVSLDLTSEVIDELNRQYAALITTAKRKIAVLGVAALDEKSQSEGLGTRVRSTVLSVLHSFREDLKLEFIPDAELQQMLELYGEAFDRPIDDVRAIEIGRNMDADFVYTGTVERQGGDIIVTIQLIKPDTREVLPAVSEAIPEKEESLLEQKVTNLVTQLQAYLVAETEE